MDIRSINIGDSLSGSVLNGLRTEPFAGVVAWVGDTGFHVANLDWSRKVAVVSHDGRKRWLFETSDATGLTHTPVDASRVLATPQGERVVILTPWARDGVYRLACGRFARIEMDFSGATADLIVRSVMAERPLTGEVL